jgi:hypothetical protein
VKGLERKREEEIELEGENNCKRTKKGCVKST